MPLHARFTIWYNSLAFPAKQHSQMIKRFCCGEEERNLKVVPTNKALAEFPLILKSRGPGTSSSMKLGVLFAFQGSPDYYRSFFFVFRVSLLIF